MMEENEIEYALAKQVPSIEQEAIIQTNYGELRFEGQAAKRIAEVVKDILERLIGPGGGLETPEPSSFVHACAHLWESTAKSGGEVGFPKCIKCGLLGGVTR